MIAIAPFGGLGIDEKDVRAAEKTVGEGVVALGNVRVIGAADVAKAIKKAKRPDLAMCEGVVKCIGDIGTLMGAARVVSGDVGGLGEGQIVYLKAVKAGGDKETGSTTAVLEGTPDARRAATTAAAFRLLAPERYIGAIRFKLDVPDAVVYVDGRKARNPRTAPVRVSVGTHAIRVTHERYRDFLRFVEVPFGTEPVVLDVEMSKFPIITDEMRGTGPIVAPRTQETIVDPLPWYQRWWVPVAGGVVITAATAAIVFVLADGVEVDQEVKIRP